MDNTTIKDVRNLFRLKKRNRWHHSQRYNKSFKLKKENKTIKNKVIRNIRNLFEHEKEEN